MLHYLIVMFQANENITTDSTYNQLPTNIVLPDDIMTLSLEASSANTGTLQLVGYAAISVQYLLLLKQ